MKTLDRYIGSSVIKSFLLVMSILLAVFSLLDFVEQLESVGNRQYKAVDAVFYVLMYMPKHMVTLAPVMALLGTVVALGSLAKGNELIAMQASGLSVANIAKSVMKTGLLVMLVAGLIGEFVAPELQQRAESRRAQAFLTEGDFLSGDGFWSQLGSRYVNVKQCLHGRIPAGIEIYDFAADGRLHTYTSAERADNLDSKMWRLVNVNRKVFENGTITSQSFPSMESEPLLTEIQARTIEFPVEALSPSDLYHYVQYLKTTDQPVDRLELNLWQKLIIPLTTGAMVLLGIPFVFGQLRSASFGSRLVLGVMAGIGFTLMDRLFANIGLFLNLWAPVIVAIPVVLVTLVALQMLRRA